MLFSLFKDYTLERVAKHGSEEFTQELTIPAGGFEVIDYEQHEVAKWYLPLNRVIFINTGNAQVKVLYNQRDYDLTVIPAGGVEKEDSKFIRSLKLINLDSTNQAEIIVKARREPENINTLVRRLI